MTRNRKIMKKIGCGLLAGTLAVSGVVPFDGSLTAEARSVIDENSTVNTVVSSPFGVTLRKLYKWCSYIDKTVNTTADSVYNHYVYSTYWLEKNVKVGKDRNGNEWYGDCVCLTFGGPHNIYGDGGSMPVIVNVHCVSNPTGVSEGTLPSGCTVEFNGEDIFAPAIEIGTNAISNTSIATLNVPETYMCIADKAFYQNKKLQNVVFLNEDGVTDNCGANLTYMGNYAFAGCESLQRAILPKQLLEAELNYDGSVRDTFDYTNNYNTNGFAKIGSNVYRDCKSLKEINIECENALIPTQAFAGCENIETINIKANYAIINYGAFSGAGANTLKNITLDCDAKIGSYAFCDNGQLQNVTFNGNVEFKENTQSEDNVESSNIFCKSFLNRSTEETSVTFNGNTSITIPAYCFSTTGYLDNIVFSDKVENITVREYAFSNTGIKNLKFTGKNVTVENGGLSGLANTTNITFNNTDATYLENSAFSTNDTNASTKSAVEKITFHSSSVRCRSFNGTSTDSSVVFGKEVEKITWGTESSRASAGTVKNVYVTNPTTDFLSGEIPNENYTIYGFPNTQYKKYRDTVATKVIWGDYIKELKIWSSDDSKDTPEMIKSVGFDASKLKVIAQKADKGEEVLPYSADGKSDGYTIDDETKKRIEDAMRSDGVTRVSLDVSYCGKTANTAVLFIPKTATNFNVAIKEGTSFAEGTKVTADNFIISNITYNDDSFESVVLNPENVSVKLKSGAETLSSGTNTVIISYHGVEKEVNVTVGDKTITKVTAKLKNPTKKYYPGNTLSSDDFIVTAEYNNGDVIENFKDFTLTYNTISENASNIVVVIVDVNGISSLVEVPVSTLEVSFLLASYTGVAVLEGDRVDKSNVTVTAVYNNDTMRQLTSSEFDLVYEPIIANNENEVKVVLLEDTTKTTSFRVAGQKRTEFDPAVPTDGTQTPIPTTQPTQDNDSNNENLIPATETPSKDNNTQIPVSGTDAPVQPTNSVNSSENPTPTSQVPNSTENPKQTVEPSIVPNAGMTKLSATSYKLGKNEKVTISLSGGKATKFESSNPDVATVTAEGVVTAQNVGSTTIMVTDEFGVVKNVNITVKKAPTAKTFKASVSKKIIKVGKKFTLKPKFKSGYYSNSITFTSNKKTIATVSNKGVVTAKKKGKAIITLKTFNGKKVKVTITVR